MQHSLKNITILFVIIISLSGCTTLQAIKRVNGGELVHGINKKSTIPFELNGHPILIKAYLNNSSQEYTFIFDTGALTVISEQLVNEFGLENGIPVNAHGTGGKTKKVNLVQLDRVVVGNAEVKNIAAVVVDLSEHFGENIDGILGSNFLRFFQVIIDYQKNEIHLLAGTEQEASPDGAIIIDFESDIKQGFAPKVQFSIGETLDGVGYVDTGHPGIALPLSTIEKIAPFQRHAVLEANGSMGGGLFGEEESSYLLRVDTLKMGNLKVSNVPMISHSLAGDYVLFGNKFLSQFLVTINYPTGKLILQPIGKSLDTNIYSYGFSITKKNKKVIVSGVWDNSSAARSDLQPGDEIMKIDSKDARNESLIQLMAILLNDNSKTIEIEFVNDEGRQRATLHKTMLLPVL